MHASERLAAAWLAMASPLRVSNAFHSPGITKILSFAQNGTAPETHSPALMAGLLQTDGLSAGREGRPHSILCSETILFIRGS